MNMTKGRRFCFSDFQYEERTRLYLASGHGDSRTGGFAYSDGEAAESYILKCVKESTDISDNSAELMSRAVNWTSFYHLGAGRSNILRALDLPKDARVLELGAGCGSITRYLGENFRSVDSVEGSYFRARIARERCRDLTNVKVFCANAGNIAPEPAYDIVALIGVLEYAPLYFGKSGCAHLIELAGEALKQDGVLIIAIENKIGLKYWSGCREDHTGKVYEGIHGYPLDGTPETFSRKEITGLLRDKGYNEIGFYSCFPDYKFASTVLSDNGDEKDLYLHDWIDVPFRDYGARRQYAFHEGLAARTLAHAGLLREMANSFMVVAGRDFTHGACRADWAAKKFTMGGRRREYWCVTTLKTEPESHVEKRKMYEGLSDENRTDALVRHTVEDSSWLSGDILVFDIYEILSRCGGEQALEDLLKEYYEELIKRYFDGAVDAAGYRLLRGNALDFIFRNVIRHDGRVLPIDNEWVMNGPVPADYMLYRCALDILNAQYPGIGRKVVDPDAFSICLIKKIMPGYNKKRHRKNQKMERALQEIIMTGIDVARLCGPTGVLIMKNRAVRAIARKAWGILPRFLKKAVAGGSFR
ncbi:MAG: class I SAM-dependent methyltransferase [Candidatus Omnitrophota bacterium]